MPENCLRSTVAQSSAISVRSRWESRYTGLSRDRRRRGQVSRPALLPVFLGRRMPLRRVAPRRRRHSFSRRRLCRHQRPRRLSVRPQEASFPNQKSQNEIDASLSAALQLVYSTWPNPSHMAFPDARPVVKFRAASPSFLLYPFFIEQSLSDVWIPVPREKRYEMINHLLF